MWFLTLLRRFGRAIGLALYSKDSSGNITGLADWDGNSVDPYEFVWTDFKNLNSTDYAGITVRVTDRHQDSRGEGGVLFTGGTSWVLESDCIYYATLASAPSPVLWPKLRIFAANIGMSGCHMTSDGAHYRPDDPYVTLCNNLSAISRAKGSTPEITTEWQPLPVRLYRDINNESVMQDGDYLEIRNAWCEKTGVTDQLYVDVRLGTGNSITPATDPSLLAAPTTSGNTNYVRVIRLLEIVRLSNIAARIRGAQSTLFNSGPLALATCPSVTIPDMDSTSDSYLNIGIYVNGAPMDTALNLREYEVRLVKGY